MDAFSRAQDNLAAWSRKAWLLHDVPAIAATDILDGLGKPICNVEGLRGPVHGGIGS